MHRVELKDRRYGAEKYSVDAVPNAPCGVESNKENPPALHIGKFLMHRVELKV